MLTKNMGQTDRTLRTVIGVVLLILAIVSLSGAWAWLSGLVGVVLLATAATGYCPPYALLGISTRKSHS
ncbi:YgaP family membrane protein [Jannaschia ovalis]|uniref:DUF2892 domain-containing protein n=1 Tax=Jannaschia ovalis TaxID=3038773 RepID=A0ABY8LC80_9RHOB|nr:DUF2892 domain-containing protein [Jannaschia sp. GRR-S6-38]WGH78227.1 DUF2892 domain-containing protein [Jannaschia sp. GRR-S6-38]